MHHAAMKGRVANLRLLLDAGADEAEMTKQDESVLDLCTQNGHDPAVEFLLGERGPATGDEEGEDEEAEATVQLASEDDRVAYALGLLH